MGAFSFWHILVVVLLIVVLFGRGRISSVMGDLAKGINAFKRGMAEGSEDKKAVDQTAENVIDVTPGSAKDPAAKNG